MYGNVDGLRDSVVTIKSIYDIGMNPYCVREGEFRALLFDAIYNISSVSDSGWVLIGTPDSEYVVPTTVGGKSISTVDLAFISGYPTFENPVNLDAFDIIGINSIKVTTSDLDFLWDVIDGNIWWYNVEIDISECGDDITIPNNCVEAMNSETTGHIIIYVSPTVKANYEEYSFIVAK